MKSLYWQFLLQENPVREIPYSVKRVETLIFKPLTILILSLPHSLNPLTQPIDSYQGTSPTLSLSLPYFLFLCFSRFLCLSSLLQGFVLFVSLYLLPLRYKHIKNVLISWNEKEQNGKNRRNESPSLKGEKFGTTNTMKTNNRYNEVDSYPTQKRETMFFLRGFSSSGFIHKKWRSVNSNQRSNFLQF